MSPDVSSCVALNSGINTSRKRPFKVMVCAVTMVAFLFNIFAYDELLSQKEIEQLGLRYKNPKECDYVFEAHKAGR